MKRFCQSCGMPMPTDDLLGTNADESLNQDYCMYCYRDGEFTQDCTMEEMIQHCVKFLEDFNEGLDKPYTPAEAVRTMRQAFPTFKRWKK